jgi:tetratricopeptide (TPR) repeat protein
MWRPAESRGLVLAGVVIGLAVGAAPVRAGEDPRTALTFVDELRGRGLHDLALEYLGLLRADPAQPAKTKEILDYEEGRTLIDEAAKTSDLVLREDLLKEARDKLERFVKAHPQLTQTREALVQMAKLLIERGHLAMLGSEDTQDAAKKAGKVGEARVAFKQAHESYVKAIEPLSAAYKKYAGFIPDNDPRKAERDQIYYALLDAMLQKGVADYELAQTYAPDATERKKSLKEALDQFDSMYKNYRTQLAGLAAQMYQAKCYEEQGNVDAAIGIYKQLMEHGDPRLRTLQRNVGYFYIVALGKRKQYALAADEASRWLAAYNRRDERRSPEGLGVLIEFAKNIEAQMPGLSSADRPKAIRQIIEASKEVVRYASPFKKDALALLKKYKPSAAVRAEEIAKLTYEDAMGQADDAIGSHEWEKAIALLTAAIKKADPARNPEKANLARYNLSFCYYMNKEYYEAGVMAEHLARRHPQWSRSAQAIDIGMQSWADAYSTYTEIDRMSDLNRLISLARYAVETWPEKEQGDNARMNLGQIYIGMGQYDKAIEVLSAVHKRSRDWVGTQNRLGAAHWAKSRDLERRGDKAAAQAETQKALDSLNLALKARREAGAGPTDPGLIGNAGDLATVLTETGKPADALALLSPIVAAQTVKSGAAYARLMEAQLKALIGSGNVEAAIASMRALEQSGGASGRAQLYYKLGKLLEKELDSLKEKGNTAALQRMHQAYKSFLTTLAESKTGQSYDSLRWAGESLLALDAYADAENVFRRVLDEFTNDPQFRQQQGGQGRMLMARLRLVSALRGQQRFREANSILDELLKNKPTYLETVFEKGMLLEAEADAGQAKWSAALKYWEDLAKRMERTRPRPSSYYDAWYHVAWVLSKQKEAAKARQALMGVMRLSPNVGGSDMKAKYLALLEKLRK